eukprot:TRINITY_DN3370_c0_g1_i1.p1 TRINITY_DN3370_c0_g1~~TRINITY_DN3370_c0_g1_i1.p1  ORF type:complete len:356 (-),score=63.63 TRINITY_DN3370_c0_g1_i1:23-1090(-)
MTFANFLGSGLIAFGPPLVLAITFLSHRPPLVVLLLGSSFFWLSSVVAASLFWYVLMPWRELYFITIPVAVLCQEAMRYAFYRLFMVARSGLQKSFTAAAIAARARIRARRQPPRSRPPVATAAPAAAAAGADATDNTNTDTNTTNTNSTNNNNDNSDNSSAGVEGETDGSAAPVTTAQQGAGMTLAPQIVKLSPEAALDNFSAALAIGLGFGLTQATVMYGSIWVDGVGPGCLFSPACPSVNLFVYSAMISVATTFMHVCLSIMSFDAFDRSLPRANRIFKTCTIIIAHLLISYFSLLNEDWGHCAAALALVYVAVLLLAGFTIPLALSSPVFLRVYPADHTSSSSPFSNPRTL